ncbi:MAG: hypothetical protein HQ596_01620 [Candidatus Saganbacteria bacterium]|nr:hypothetical protein [Candidatus Saganbacteria bacterium]
MKKLLVLFFVLSVILIPTAAMAGNLGVGVWGNWPVLRYNFPQGISGSLGLAYTSTGGTTTLPILVKVDYNLRQFGKVQEAVGVYYTTNGAATVTTTIGLTWGAEAALADNLTIGPDLVVVNSSTTAGVSTTRVLPSVSIKAALYL